MLSIIVEGIEHELQKYTNMNVERNVLHSCNTKADVINVGDRS